ncbi:agmatine deiminase family protein, partial [Escherichia coli]|nr:agmatine deiminase family protein [Escherichia coli]
EANFVQARYGDIWLRDTGPIFARTHLGPIALRFATNSWGGKYDLPDDATVGDDIANIADVPIKRFDFVLEGGAVDQDGEGT